jgi:hypothetical protein
MLYTCHKKKCPSDGVCVPSLSIFMGSLGKVFSPNFGFQSQPARKERAEPESGDCGSVFVVHRVVGAEQLQQQAAEQVSLLINQVDGARN